jgi:phosphatidylglycerophosphatase A
MKRPSFRLMMSHPAHLLSFGFGSGLAARAPGTFGSFLAWAIYLVVRPQLSDLAFGVLILVSFLIGMWVVGVTGKALGIADHGGIVWDEFVAVWLVLWLTPASLAWQFAAVLVFRVFDIAKPWPIRWADERFDSGFGVMFDDLLAATYTVLCLTVLVRLWG